MPKKLEGYHQGLECQLTHTVITSLCYSTILLKVVPTNQGFIISHYLPPFIQLFSLIFSFFRTSFHMPHFSFCVSILQLIFTTPLYLQIIFMTTLSQLLFSDSFCDSHLQPPFHNCFLATTSSCNSAFFSNHHIPCLHTFSQYVTHILMQLAQLQLIHLCMSDAPHPNVLCHVHLC